MCGIAGFLLKQGTAAACWVMRRLSIIDLATGEQPITREHPFRTHIGTETILHLHLCWA